jgi:hypothetical protein
VRFDSTSPGASAMWKLFAEVLTSKKAIATIAGVLLVMTTT